MHQSMQHIFPNRMPAVQSSSFLQSNQNQIEKEECQRLIVGKIIQKYRSKGRSCLLDVELNLQVEDFNLYMEEKSKSRKFIVVIDLTIQQSLLDAIRTQLCEIVEKIAGKQRGKHFQMILLLQGNYFHEEVLISQLQSSQYVKQTLEALMVRENTLQQFNLTKLSQYLGSAIETSSEVQILIISGMNFHEQLDLQRSIIDSFKEKAKNASIFLKIDGMSIDDEIFEPNLKEICQLSNVPNQYSNFNSAKDAQIVKRILQNYLKEREVRDGISGLVINILGQTDFIPVKLKGLKTGSKKIQQRNLNIDSKIAEDLNLDYDEILIQGFQSDFSVTFEYEDNNESNEDDFEEEKKEEVLPLFVNNHQKSQKSHNPHENLFRESLSTINSRRSEVISTLSHHFQNLNLIINNQQQQFPQNLRGNDDSQDQELIEIINKIKQQEEAERLRKDEEMAKKLQDQYDFDSQNHNDLNRDPQSDKQSECDFNQEDFIEGIKLEDVQKDINSQIEKSIELQLQKKLDSFMNSSTLSTQYPFTLLDELEKMEQITRQGSYNSVPEFTKMYVNNLKDDVQQIQTILDEGTRTKRNHQSVKEEIRGIKYRLEKKINLKLNEMRVSKNSNIKKSMDYLVWRFFHCGFQEIQCRSIYPATLIMKQIIDNFFKYCQKKSVEIFKVENYFKIDRKPVQQIILTTIGPNLDSMCDISYGPRNIGQLRDFIVKKNNVRGEKRQIRENSYQSRSTDASSQDNHSNQNQNNHRRQQSNQNCRGSQRRRPQNQRVQNNNLLEDAQIQISAQSHFSVKEEQKRSSLIQISSQNSPVKAQQQKILSETNIIDSPELEQYLREGRLQQYFDNPNPILKNLSEYCEIQGDIMLWNEISNLKPKQKPERIQKILMKKLEEKEKECVFVCSSEEEMDLLNKSIKKIYSKFQINSERTIGRQALKHEIYLSGNSRKILIVYYLIPLI
eukprot:403353946